MTGSIFPVTDSRYFSRHWSIKRRGWRKHIFPAKAQKSVDDEDDWINEKAQKAWMSGSIFPATDQVWTNQKA